MRPGLKPPFSGGKLMRLGKFNFIKKKIEQNFSFFIKPVSIANSTCVKFQLTQFWNFADEKMHIFGAYLLYVENY